MFSATYSGKILHADLCHACAGHGLGLMSIGVIIGRKIYFLHPAAYSSKLQGQLVGWTVAVRLRVDQ